MIEVLKDMFKLTQNNKREKNYLPQPHRIPTRHYAAHVRRGLLQNPRLCVPCIAYLYRKSYLLFFSPKCG